MAETAVLVHGAWHSPWCWHKVVDELAEHGIRSVLVDLPSCRGGAGPADLHADVAEIRRVLDGCAGDVILVAHSYGGIPATEAAAGHPVVRRLVYVAAYLADADETLMGYALPDAGPDVLDPARDLVIDPGTGLMTVRPERAVPIFCADLDPAAAAEAVRHLRPMSAAVLDQSPAAVAWRALPTTYLITGRDNATPTVVQRRLSRRAGEVLELADSSHSPFLSHPKAVAEAIAGSRTR
ncbi:alpha/beta fold hydrolase [Streptomyces sp. VRA16 Mangrove soil]|uniref:alpha/beta fold hydrolase n=1 Tax=Streptomyces sp. VRA16 Mangrove soil TaxID=2817434 RepID=UPI001A9E7874|nr:alpha/beta hydrolase [Streptomyces sp. VRA16 Mangrove soil]MBO1330055.1 alpha/beta hydrolase [Streptomyces sp. VRA16 Mangrove soil]